MLRPCLLLSDRPCAAPRRAGADAFEVHLTTAPLGADALRAYREACRELGVKALVIELAPHLPVQPMTCGRVEGDEAAALAAAREWAAALAARGFPTLRVKVEAAPWNAGVPITDEDAARADGGRYFEFHARLALPPGADAARLADAARAHGAHVSRNPLKVREDGVQERFVTLRTPGAGREATEARADALTADLARAGFAVASTVLEYCVFDDRLDLDAGWGDAGGGNP